jgi:hypothetical protein
MSTRTRIAPIARRLPLLLAGAVLVATGCADSPALLEPDQLQFSSSSDIDALFNPQPDPYRVLEFMIDTPELIDNPELLDWRGTFGGRDGLAGDLIVSMLPAVQRGEALHLRQSWQLVPSDGSTLPAIQLDGVLNLSTGDLVLNGVNGDGTRVHVRGFVATTGGTTSIGGHLMFNPQPDPPKVF